MHAEIVVCLKQGIGDELTVIGPLVGSLLTDGWTVGVVTHHPLLYSNPNLDVRDWRNAPHEFYRPMPCDLGACLVSRPGFGLPLEFDRTPLARETCLAQGYKLLDGDGRDSGRDFENGYDYSRFVLTQLGLNYYPPPWPFLDRNKGDKIVLVPFGHGDLAKGMAPDLAWSVVQRVGESLPCESFVMPMIETMPCPPQPLRLPDNVALERRPYGDPDLMRIHLRAKCMVTAEGGGYHIARAADIPALLVISTEWLAKVHHAIPPEPRSIIPFDHQRPDAAEIAERVTRWITARLT
jgi:hypothetical protein